MRFGSTDKREREVFRHFPLFFPTVCSHCNDSYLWERMWTLITGPFHGPIGKRKYYCEACAPTKIDAYELGHKIPLKPKAPPPPPKPQTRR